VGPRGADPVRSEWGRLSTLAWMIGPIGLRHPLRSVRPGGLPLPLGVIQLFPFTWRRDEVHVIVFLAAHPDYEALEAMIGAERSGRRSARTILTRHDGSQIDHVNDRDSLAGMAGSGRSIVEREISVELGENGGGRLARLSFSSLGGEAVEFVVTSRGEPDARGAGLTDPGAHSAKETLPLMQRLASAPCGPDTWASIDGVEQGISRGFFTLGFSMAAFRAGRIERPLAANRPVAVRLDVRDGMAEVVTRIG
ncbi:MAG: hypothetical protein ACREEH_06945, partial [Caulobacteraceae bacterium]